MKNLGQLMKQAQEMQEKMGSFQESLAELDVTGTAGGGMVMVSLNGKGEMHSLKIDPNLIDPSELEILEDLVVAAHNDAKTKLEQIRKNAFIFLINAFLGGESFFPSTVFCI